MKFLPVLLALMLPILPAAAEETTMDAKLDAAFAAGDLPGLHGVLVLSKGAVIAERYFPGEDERWGRPLGTREHGPDTLHDLRSVTKSVVGLLYGIALAEGKVPPLDAPLIAQFPDYADLVGDPERDAILVRHALSMRMGTEWNEDLPYSDPRNSEIAMELAEDRYRYVLDRPMVNEPGDWWSYNGGAVAIVAKLIADGTGMPIDVYAKAKLFDPLGIEAFDWVCGADDVPSAASGLRLTLRDMAKIGRMVVARGEWEGEQIVPADWLDVSFTPHAKLQKTSLRYGYLWWLSPVGDPPNWAAGFGNGGQRLSVNTDLGLIVAVFAGNYNQLDAWKLPVKVIEDFVVPELFP